MRKNLLTKKGEALVEYIKSGARNNPEFEQTLLDIQNIIKEKQGFMPTNESSFCVFRVSSQAIISTLDKTERLLSVISAKFPIGVGTKKRVDDIFYPFWC